MRSIYYSILVITISIFSFDAWADTESDSAHEDARVKYDECIGLLNWDAAVARENAEQWIRAGGGYPARHCEAMALAKLGAYGNAAEKLHEMATNSEGGTQVERTDFLLQAGDFWLEDQQPKLASEAYLRAINLTADTRDAYIGWARSAASLADWATAVNALTQGLSFGADAEMLSLRAAARRYLQNHSAALQDANTAIALEPSNALGWFEKGAALRGLGYVDSAREAWLTAVSHDPDGPIAEMAQTNLQKMSVSE